MATPDGYGWVDFGDKLPLTADRVARLLTSPAIGRSRRHRCSCRTYYNPYISRGQRFMPYTGCGGPHPMSGAARVLGRRGRPPVHQGTLNNVPQTPEAPTFTGKVEAPAVNPGSSGLRP